MADTGRQSGHGLITPVPAVLMVSAVLVKDGSRFYWFVLVSG